MFCCFHLVYLYDHLFRIELFIRFAVSVFRARLSIYVCSSFPFGFESGVV